MIDSLEHFDGTFPFKPHFSDIHGFKMHYVDEGEGEILLCLHGEPTWGYLYRHLVSSLRNRYRIIVPDHMGFGKSETPQKRTYWLQDHIDNLEKFVLGLDLRDITLVMHDFGGPVGMGLLSRHPDRIKRVIAVNGPTPFAQKNLLENLVSNAGQSPWFQWIIKSHENKTLVPVLEQLHYNILSTLKLNGFENNNLITDTWIESYRSHFKEPKNCSGAIGWALGFATGAHVFETPTLETISLVSKKPAMAIWGLCDRTLKAEFFLPLFKEIFPLAPIHLLSNVGHYSLEDAPEEILSLIINFLKV
jgi:haloalkane dehalogenase